jgi:hypothetical protein
MDSMNVMAKAHELTRNAMAQVDKSVCVITYKQAFSVYLREAHYMNKQERQAIELYKADTIAKFEKRIEELKILAPSIGHKFMVVCGDDHPMPVDFEAKDPKWPWALTENATHWNSVQFARANAQKVMNGNKQAGKAVLIADHIEWDIAQLVKLIDSLKN